MRTQVVQVNHNNLVNNMGHIHTWPLHMDNHSLYKLFLCFLV